MAQERIKIVAELDSRKANREFDALKKRFSKLSLDIDFTSQKNIKSIVRDIDSITKRKTKINFDTSELKTTERGIQRIKEEVKKPLKLSTSVDEKEFDAFKKEYRKLLNSNTKLNVGVKVSNTESVERISREIDELRKKTQSDINVRFNVKQDSNIFNQINKNTQAGGRVIASALTAYAGSEAAYFVNNQVGQIRQSYLDIEDEATKVAKSIGLTNEEIAGFIDDIFNLSKDTRTKNLDLIKIAQIGGQINVPKDDIIDFTDSINTLNVALGDEFSGGVEQITNEVGTLANLTKDLGNIKLDDKILRIGNAINELGASGLATGEVVTDFSKRILGLAPRLGTANILGLSASLQELGVEAERGGSNVGRIVSIMSKPDNIEPFANVLGITAEKYKELVNADPNEVLLQIAQTLQTKYPEQTDLSAALDDLGLNAVGASEVIQKLGANTDLVRERQKLATDAIKETSSVTEEYNRVNSTAKAEQEKFNNRVEAFKTKAGEPLAKALNKVMDAFSPFLDGLIDFTAKNPEIVGGFIALASALTTVGAGLATLGAAKAGLQTLGLFKGASAAATAAAGATSAAGTSGIISGTGAAGAGLGLGGALLAGATLLGVGAAGAGAGYLAYKKNTLGFGDSINNIINNKAFQNNKNTGQTIGLGAGATSGAFAGATIGSAVLPGIGTLIGGIAGGLGGSILGTGAGGFLGDNADNIKKFFTEDIKNYLNEAGNSFQSWYQDRIDDASSWIEQTQSNINEFFTQDWGDILNKAAFNFAQFLGENARNIVDFAFITVPESLQNVSQAFSDKYEEAKIEASKKIVEIGIETVKFATVTVPDAIKDTGKYFGDKYNEAKEFVSSSYTEMEKFAQELPVKTALALVALPEKIREKYNEAIDGARESYNQLVEYASGIDDRIAAKFDSLGDKLKSKFQSAVDKAGGVLKQLENTSSSIIDKRNEINRNLLAGFAEGFAGSRAEGGFVAQNKNYRVNELGTELFATRNKITPIRGNFFSPPENGVIIPADISSQLMNRAEQSVSQVINNTFNNQAPAQSAGINAQYLSNLINQQLRQVRI